jgi:hypothetical protein
VKTGLLTRVFVEDPGPEVAVWDNLLSIVSGRETSSASTTSELSAKETKSSSLG